MEVPVRSEQSTDPLGFGQREHVLRGDAALVGERGAAAHGGERPRAGGPMGGREAAAPHYLLPLGKVVEQAEWGEVRSILVRAKDCRCGVCQKCSPKRAHREALFVAQVADTFKRPMLITLGCDPTIAPEDPMKLLKHLKEKRAVGEFIRSLRAKGLITGKAYVALEFQDETQQPHWHLLVDAKGRHRSRADEGWIPKDYMDERWGKFRPEWAGPRKLFGEEHPVMAGQLRPGLGWTDVRPIKNRKEVIAYVTAYVGKPGKNPIPDYFIEYCDDGHNAVLKSCTRGFFEGVKKPRPKREIGRRRRKVVRRKVRERTSSCRRECDVMEVIETIRNGEIVPGLKESKYLGTVRGDAGFSRVAFNVLPFDQAQALVNRSGFFTDWEGLGRVLQNADNYAFLTHGLKAIANQIRQVDEELEPLADPDVVAAKRRDGPDEFDAFLERLSPGRSEKLASA